MDKEKRIKAEKEKLLGIFADIPESKKKLCAKLIDNAAFMSATLDDLQEIINEKGPVITAVNGNGFETTQEHPAQKSYVGMIAKYQNVINQLNNLLPDKKAEAISSAGDKLGAFITKGKPIELR